MSLRIEKCSHSCNKYQRFFLQNTIANIQEKKHRNEWCWCGIRRDWTWMEWLQRLQIFTALYFLRLKLTSIKTQSLLSYKYPVYIIFSRVFRKPWWRNELASVMMLRISVNSVECHIAIAGRLHVKVIVEGLDDFRVHNSAHEEDGSYEKTK